MRWPITRSCYLSVASQDVRSQAKADGVSGQGYAWRETRSGSVYRETSEVKVEHDVCTLEFGRR